MRKLKAPAQSAAGQIRLIAGQWRGRRLPVVDAPGLRPTGDRVRETLFNWMQAEVAGARCLDLYAGTGALGLEALSRYAQATVFVEPNLAARQGLTDACRTLDIKLLAGGEKSAGNQGADGIVSTAIYAGKAADFLASNLVPFDIVFIDPPFEHALQWEILAELIPEHLASSALIYIEAPANQQWPEPLPAGCRIHRDKCFGDVHARLLRFSAD